MKNILGTQEDLTLYNKAGIMIYEFCKRPDGWLFEYTYSDDGYVLTGKNSNGYSWERTYDENGNELTFKDSDGFWYESTYDESGNELTFKNSNGAIIKRICRISHQRKVAQEFTMEQLVEKIGNFKLIK